MNAEATSNVDICAARRAGRDRSSTQRTTPPRDALGYAVAVAPTNTLKTAGRDEGLPIEGLGKTTGNVAS